VSDIRSIAAVHRAAFRSFFLTQLGPAFLRAYYRTVLEHPGGILLVAVQDESIVGFSAGFIDPPGFYSLLRKKRIRLGLAALPWLITHPANLARTIWNYRLTLEESRESDPGISQVAELSSIAVRPNGQGVGAGRQLLAVFVDAARGSGAARVTLTTDAAGSDATNRFYARAGFTLARVIRRPYGRILNEYELNLGLVGSEAVISQYLPERMDHHVKE
jgi:ribosomal protein S18 acetylase RimI-like enzyme